MSNSETGDDWEKEFETHLASKNCSFLKLMYDRNNAEQKDALKRIACGNKHDAKNWLQYIECTVNSKANKEKQAQLLRMVNNCLSLLSPVDQQLSEDSSFLAIHLQVIALKRSDEQAVQYFSTVMSRSDKNKKLHDIIIGRSHATLYLRWCETILRLTDSRMASKDSLEDKNKERLSGVVSAIKVLQTAIENKVTPNGQIKVQLRDLVKEGQTLKMSFNDGVVSFNRSKTVPSVSSGTTLAKSPDTIAEDSGDESTDEVTQTQAIEQPITAPVVPEEEPAKRSTRSAGTASGTPVALEDMKSIKVSRTGLSGKCVRLTKVKDELSESSPVSARPSAASKPPVNLSLYVDDKMKNFNPVWKPKESPAPVQITKPDTPIVPLSSVASKSKVPFSIADTNIEVNTSLNKKAANSKRSSASAEKVEENGHDLLNDSVVEFKQNKRPRASALSVAKSPKKDSAVVFKNQSKSPSKGKTVTASSPESDSDDDGNTATATMSVCDATETIAVAGSCAGLGEVSVFYDGETVKIEPSSADVDQEEATATAEGDTVPVVDVAIADSGPATPAYTPVVAPAAPAGRLMRSHTEPAALGRIPSAASASPMPVSALATPVSNKQKKRGRVSFAGNEDLPPVLLAPESVADPATASKLHNGRAVDTAASSSASHMTSSVSSSAAALSAGRNMLDDVANRVVLNNREYVQLGALGKGGSGVVTRVISKDTGAMYAYKRINIPDNLEPDVVDKQIDDHMKEISLLKQLNGSPLIVELIDSEINRDESTVCMILEMGETDLAKVLISYQKQGQDKARGSSGNNMIKSLDPFYARMIWKEMLECVQYIHMKNIIHGDLKPANFVFVKGHLKLIDFGIANSITNDTTNVYLQSQVGTLNYMSPEALTPTEVKSKHADPDAENQNERSRTMRLGRSSDVWSLGCILYQMMYGRPPFAAHSMFQKIGVITDPNHVIEYPAVNGSGSLVDPAAIESMKACLIHDRTQRRTIGGPAGLLNMTYLTMSGSAGVSITASSCSLTSSASEESVVHSGQVKGVVEAVLAALSSELSASRGSSTPSKKAKVDSLLSLINGVDRTALVRSVHTQLNLSSDGRSNNTSLELSTMESDFPNKIQRTSSNDTSRYPSTPSGKIPSTSVGLSSTAKVKKLFASSLASSLAEATKANSGSSSSSSSGAGSAVAVQPVSAVKKARTPLKRLDLNLQNQITAMTAKTKLNSVSSSVGAKWMKPVAAVQVNDMRSAMEERLGNMRKFMNPDQDDITVTETIDNTGFNFDQF